jgi:hypothetical protein
VEEKTKKGNSNESSSIAQTINSWDNNGLDLGHFS